MTLRLSFWACVFALLAFPLAGCSETSGAGGEGGNGGAGGTDGEVRMYMFSFTELKEDGSTPDLEGVEVCEDGTGNCDMSNAGGFAGLNIPADQQVTFTFEKDGYGSYIVGDVSDENYGPTAGADLVAPFRMFTVAQLEAAAQQVDTTYPWTGGMVGLVRVPELHVGTTFIPVGSTADGVGDSFYFDAAKEEYSLTLEATTAVEDGHLLPLGYGGFTEVTPGEGVQQFELGGTAGVCVPSWAWPGDGQNQIKVPVREGYRTYASMVCEESQ